MNKTINNWDTCLPEILESEQHKYERMLRNSTVLIKVLDKYESKDHQRLGIISIKYANILFGFHCATCDANALEKINQDCYNGGHVDKFKLQKLIKEYLGNIDSTLDYLHKFVGSLKDKSIAFDRDGVDFCKRINDLRNDVLHEGVPTISLRHSGNSVG